MFERVLRYACLISMKEMVLDLHHQFSFSQINKLLAMLPVIFKAEGISKGMSRAINQIAVMIVDIHDHFLTSLCQMKFSLKSKDTTKELEQACDKCNMILSISYISKSYI